VFIEAKDDGGGGDNWTTGAISRAKLQSNHHHQQTNIQFFTGRMPFLTPNQQSFKMQIGMDSLTPTLNPNPSPCEPKISSPKP